MNTLSFCLPLPGGDRLFALFGVDHHFYRQAEGGGGDAA